jgi:hypothetical protein
MTDWSQTPKTVTITIPIGYNVAYKDIKVTENFIMLNIPGQMIKYIYLYGEVDIETSRIVIETQQKRVVFYLDKLNEDKWPSLEHQGSKQEKENRRKIAEEKYEQRLKDLEEKTLQQKKENEKFVFDKSIKLGEEKRKELNEAKDQEKSRAERELYDFVSEMGNSKNNKTVDQNEGVIEEVTTSSTNVSKNVIDKVEQRVETYNEVKKPLVNNEIFQDSELPVDNPSSAIRPETKFNVNLTEKMIPHFAARESLAKEPPYPKSKNLFLRKIL